MRLSRGRLLGKLERRPTRVVDTLALGGGGGPNLTFRLSNSHLPLDMRTWGREKGATAAGSFLVFDLSRKG